MNQSLYRRGLCRKTLVLASISAFTPALSAAEEKRQLDAHEHGVTEVNIALDDSSLVIELEGPAMNFIGFEHPARTAEQKQAIADAIEILRDGQAIFTPDPAAGCRLVSAAARHVTDSHTDGEQDEHDHEHHHDDHHDSHHDDHASATGQHDGHAEHGDEDDHAEFAAEYNYACENPGRLAEIGVRLFEGFPLTEEVEASFVGPTLQTFATLTKNNYALSLEP